MYKKKGTPRVAVQAAGGLVVGKSIWRCSSRGLPWWGNALIGLAVLSELALYMVGLL